MTLFNVLDYRMNKKLPTVFTSHYTLDELGERYYRPDVGSPDAVRSKRLMERFNVSSHLIDGPNRRKANDQNTEESEGSKQRKEANVQE